MPPDRDRDKNRKPVAGGHLHVHLRNCGCCCEVDCTKEQADAAVVAFQSGTEKFLSVDNAVFLMSEVVGLDYCETRHRD